MNSKKLILELRGLTSAGMMECKKALEETEYDIKKAQELLAKKGIARAASKVNRETKQGVVCVLFNEDCSTLCITQINSESDFVARNEKFQQFAKKISKIALDTDGNLQNLLSTKTEENISVSDYLSKNIATIGENLSINSVKKIHITKPDNQHIGYYIHNKIGEDMGSIASAVLLEFATEENTNMNTLTDNLQIISRRISLHIAGSNPTQIQQTVNGNIADDAALISQRYVLNEKLSVEEFLHEERKKLNLKTLVVKDFIRVQLGDNP